MTEIFLVRHPETVHNIDRAIVSGRSNEIELTPRGVEQARRFAHAFAKAYPQPDALYSSPALRTRTLMDTYLQETEQTLPYTIDYALQEMGQGLAEGMQRSIVYTPEVVGRINEELFDFKFEGGESLNDVSTRMHDWVRRVHEAHPRGTILAAGHGQAIRRLVGSVLDWDHYQNTLDPATMTPNVSLTHLTADDEGITVHYMGKEIIEPVEEL